jgi:phosphoglycerol transferase MdoB-like AlkP superfamily enzyme
MWIIFICTLPIMYYFAGMITNLTWDDFTIVDESYQHGIMLRNVLLPVIPVCIMLLWYTLFCDIKTKIAQINLCILYLFGVTLMLIHLAFPSVL